MPERRVLFFDGTVVTAYAFKAGHARKEGAFLADSLGMDAFDAWLGQHRHSVFFLLADVADEGFQLESIPYVRGGDRTALLTRRLSQYYFNTALSVAISLGRDDTGRRDESILFAALARPDLFRPWLDALQKFEIPLAGVYSVPLVLSESPAPYIGQREHCLLLTLTSAGLRQTYFARGKIHFSRLTQLASREPLTIAATCLSEASKTYQYLIGQRQIKRGTRLSTLLPSSAGLAAILRAECPDTTDIQFEFPDIDGLARPLGMKSAIPDSAWEPLLAHQLLARPPRHQFAHGDERRFYRIWQINAAIRGTAIAILAAALMLGGRMALQWHELREDSRELQQQSATDNQRYQSLLASLPKVALSAADLRAVIAGFEQLQKRAGGFEELLNHLANTLDEMPEIELQRIDWSLSGAANAKVGAGATAPSTTATTTPSARFALEIQGHLPPAMAKDQRAMVELLDRFATRLQRNDVSAELTKRPIDVESAKSFKSQRGEELSSAPRFTLRLSKPVSS